MKRYYNEHSYKLEVRGALFSCIFEVVRRCGKVQLGYFKKEFILGDYESVRDFAAQKGIKYNGYFAEKTKGWAEGKRARQEQKQSKIIEKTIEKIAKKEPDRNVAYPNAKRELKNGYNRPKKVESRNLEGA